MHLLATQVRMRATDAYYTFYPRAQANDKNIKSRDKSKHHMLTSKVKTGVLRELATTVACCYSDVEHKTEERLS